MWPATVYLATSSKIWVRGHPQTIKGAGRMRWNKRAVAGQVLVGAGLVGSAIGNGAAGAMAVGDLQFSPAGVFLTTAMAGGPWTTPVIAVGAQSLGSCMGASASGRSTRRDAPTAPVFGVGVLQSDTTTFPPPPPPLLPRGIKRDLCADALKARYYWCDRADGPNGTKQDMDNCKVWDMMASFLCFVSQETVGNAAGSSAYRRTSPLWGSTNYGESLFPVGRGAFGA